MDDVTGTAAEDRVELILAREREAPVPTGLVARKPVPVVPAPRPLAQVAGQCPDVADLRRGHTLGRVGQYRDSMQVVSIAGASRWVKWRAP